MSSAPTPTPAATAGDESLHTALARLWRAVHSNEPDLPAVEFTVAKSRGPRRLVDYAQYTSSKWIRRSDAGTEQHVGEVTITVEALEKGVGRLFAAVLHVAAHALAEARGVYDTSREGRYHNGLFRDIAQELGLTAEQHGSNGWSKTVADDDTISRYQPQHDALAAALTAHDRVPDAPAPAARLLRARCECTPPRPLYTSRTSFEAGEIICGKCKANFVLDPA